MKKTTLFEALATFSLLSFCSNPLQAASSSFTLSATNVTMSSSAANGTGSSTVTLTPEDGYSGEVFLTCNVENAPAGAKVPNCIGSVLQAITLSPSGIVKATVSLYNKPVPEPVASTTPPSHPTSVRLTLACVVLLGLGFRRRSPRWLVLALFAFTSLAGLCAMNGCGGSNSIVTPGTYTYALRGLDNNGLSEATTFQVTVP